jgi:hypothetical protein
MQLIRVFALIILVACLATACSAIISSTTGRMADSLAAALVNQNDPETVRQAAPAYLVLIDGLIEDDPDNPKVLMAGAQLYSSYAGAFVDDPERAKRLSLKGRDYGWQALCRTQRATCGAWVRPYDEFEPIVRALDDRELEALYVAASAWATWIRVNQDDWGAIADKARVDLMMRRVVELDESHGDGMAHVLLGVLATLLPEAMGGHPEEGREHFERAIELSGGRNLMAQVMLARGYARLTFDRELHDRLLREVIESPAEEPGLTLVNTLAQEEARELLAESEAYFGE